MQAFGGGGELGHRVEAVAGPGRSVNDQLIGQGQQPFGAMRVERRVAWPPQGNGQVVDKQRHDDRGKVKAGLAAGSNADRLRAGLGPAGGRRQSEGFDAGLQTGLAVWVGGREDE